MVATTASADRFSARAKDVSRYRPDYPEAFLELIIGELELRSTDVIADIGSGTGKSTELLWKTGNVVYAIEPNEEMRAEAEARLRSTDRFFSVNGTAERTGLPNHSIDVITAFQAFHWFDPVPARTEFKRILRAGGRVALVWYDRRLDSPFEQAYEEVVVRFGTDYQKVKVGGFVRSDAVKNFFSPSTPRHRTLDLVQRLDLPGLRGRTRSSSVIPRKDDQLPPELEEVLSDLYRRHQHEGFVELGHDLHLFTARM